MNEAAVLRATMTDSGTFTRQVWNGSGWSEKVIYEQLACALSRSPQAATPRVRGQWEEVAETDTPLALFLPAGTVLQAGDRAEIFREGMLYRGICSAGLAYPSYVYATVLLQEVEQA